MKREKYVDRKCFSYEEKENTLVKSEHRCCHCGVSLTVKTMTIDHFIPLSKGGTNEEWNLTALCEKCNQYKDNDVILPQDYYAYLKQEYLSELLKQYQYYCEDYTWYNTKNFIKEDKIAFTYENTPIYGNLKNIGKNVIMGRMLKSEAVLDKVKTEDFDEVLSYVKKYHKKMRLDDSEIEKIFQKVYKIGAIYKLHTNTDILAVIPLFINLTSIDNIPVYVYRMPGLPCNYQKSKYIALIQEVIRYIYTCLASLNPESKIIVETSIPNNDTFLKEVFKPYVKLEETCSGEEEFTNYYIACVMETIAEHELRNSEKDKLISLGTKNVFEYSDFLTRLYHLKPQNIEKEDTLKKKPKKKREKREYDEYDIEYYR